MRWLLTITVVALAAPAYAGEKDAEKLFRRMEAKVRDAKTIQVRFDATMTIAGIAGSVKGKTALGESDQVYFEADINWGDRKSQSGLVDTGAKLFVKGEGNPSFDRKDRPKAKGLGDYFRTALPRFGVFFVLEDATKGIELGNATDDFKASDFKLGAKENVAGAETQVVEYTVVLKGKEKVSAKMWINTKTNLPAKLEVRLVANGLPVALSETYLEYALDGEVDAKLFAEPT
jgi:outer membrane lipoprotein-sorting protein